MSRTLRADSLRKKYKQRTILDGISLNVQQGEVVGLLGANGAGKSTCFYMVVGLITADAGNVYLDDQDVTKLPIHRRAALGIGYLPQEASVFRALSVRDNILAAIQMRKSLSSEQKERLLQDLMAELNIGHLANVHGASLSGGERRRVEVARALALEPAFLLLDEPFAGVDPIAVSDIQDIIRMFIQRGIGVLITDHNVRETLAICDRAYILGEGKILAEGTGSQLVEDPMVRKTYLGDNFAW
ncbi:MAG: LPS export ABC transporter ATP-binding protein [Gammaproteobacteria bacterium]|nr:LPS export ABC transporter ATP-binding protein [Gammaproteobacteria bacterium]